MPKILSCVRSEGSSYEWNYAANNQPIEQPGANGGIAITAERARLMYDYENFHMGSTNGVKNVLYGDGRVGALAVGRQFRLATGNSRSQGLLSTSRASFFQLIRLYDWMRLRRQGWSLNETE